MCNKHYKRWRKDNPEVVAQRANNGECSADACQRKARTRGMCNAHYNQWLAAGTQCSVEGCCKPVFARSWCGAHYMKWKRTGTPHRLNVEQRFFASIEPAPNSCWGWTGTREERGYGNFYVGDQTFKAHRWSFEFFICDIPAELEVDHICLNKSCVNPWHLELVPGIENQRRRHGVYNSDLRLCMHGHQMTLNNV
jgi:hypothetical protein